VQHLLLLGEVGGDEEEGVDDEDDAGDDAKGAEGQARVPVEGRLKYAWTGNLFRCFREKATLTPCGPLYYHLLPKYRPIFSVIIQD
jgi:hypothetical protein